jgi:hypothetical protein
MGEEGHLSTNVGAQSRIEIYYDCSPDSRRNLERECYFQQFVLTVEIAKEQYSETRT